MNEQVSVVITVAVVFYGIYMIINGFTDFLLKRKIIKAGHIDKAGIMDHISDNADDKKNNTLKWGLVAMSAGLGIIVVELMSNSGGLNWMKDNNSLLPLGIELVFIASGFLSYFFIVNHKKQ